MLNINTGQDGSLPTGVVIRTPSPVGQPIVSAPIASGARELVSTYNGPRAIAHTYSKVP